MSGHRNAILNLAILVSDGLLTIYCFLLTIKLINKRRINRLVRADRRWRYSFIPTISTVIGPPVA